MRYTYLDLIEEVLRYEKREMTLGEIWKVAEKSGYSKKLMSIGKTPVNTMNACLRKHIENPRNVKFKKGSSYAFYYSIISIFVFIIFDTCRLRFD